MTPKWEHRTWWVTFKSGAAACYEGTRAEVEERIKAAGKGEIASIETLPYPADPRTEPMGKCPSFCYTPRECKGRTACPRKPCCTE